MQMVHRLSAMLYLGFDISSLDHVLHRCDNTWCFNPEHLFIGTHTDNMRDMFVKGRRKPANGEKISTARLTEEQVRDIRTRYAQGVRIMVLSREFGVCRATIKNVVDRQAWKHVT